jgi:thiamine transport system permease protein
LGGLSALGSLALGLILALGMNGLSTRWPSWQRPLRLGLLFPIYLPPFFVILTFFYWLDFAPLGLASSIFAQVMTYAGFASVLIVAMMNERLQDLSEVARLQGVSRWSFFWLTRGIWSRPVVALFVFVFAVSFSSFSIPFVLGGGRGTTLEILIYEKIKISQEFGLALWLSLLQSVFLGVLVWKVPSQAVTARGRSESSPLFCSTWAGLILVMFLIFQFFPWIGQSPSDWRQAWRQVSEAPDFFHELLGAGVQSLFLAISAMSLVFVLGLLFVWEMIRSSIPGLLRSYFPLSVSLIGMTGIILSDQLGNQLAYIVSFVLMVFPSVFRLGLDSKMGVLKSQVHVARVLGASRWLVFTEVIFPQIKGELTLMMGMTFLWTIGDFAVARFFMPTGSTLTLLIENLMTSYRIQGAILLGLIVLALGSGMQLILWKVFNVSRSES